MVTAPAAARAHAAGGPGAPDGAWRAFRAALASPGYRRHLALGGVIPGEVARWSDLPFLDRASVFADATTDWVPAGLTAAAEIMCSSGHSGRPLALGVVSRTAAAAGTALVDGALAAMGASPSSPTLLVNLLPMGIALPTRLATTCTPSVHLEMALEVLERYTAPFDRVVLAGEPLFLAEVARRWSAGGGVHPCVRALVGGEWVPEPLRARVARWLGAPEPAPVTVSLGAAEVGLHVLHETPALAVARAALWARPGIAARLGLAAPGGPDAPSLLTWDPDRVHVEERHHGDGAVTLALTPLGEVAMPLVRYDLGDAARVLAPDDVAVLSAATGTPLPPRVAAVSGRRGGLALAGGGVLRPEPVAELLFGDDVLADALTGRFRLRPRPGGGVDLHVEGRDDGDLVAPAVATALRGLGRGVEARAGVPVAVVPHGAGGYPHHRHGDWTHKPRYLDGEVR